MCTGPALRSPIEVAYQVKNIIDDVDIACLNKSINRFHQEIKVPNLATMDCIVKTLIRLARNNDTAEHVIGLEAFADIIVGLRSIMPTFSDENGAPVTFARHMVFLMQCEFQLKMTALMRSVSTSKHESFVEDMTFIVEFIGQFAVRKLVSAKVVDVMLAELLFSQQYEAEESLVLAACKVLHTCGHVIVAVKNGDIKMTKIMAKLSDLAALKIYSDELREQVNMLQEARQQQWPARGGSKVVLQYEIVSKTAAADMWSELKQDSKLSVNQMQQCGSTVIDEATQHIRLMNMISGKTMALVLADAEDFCETQEFRDEIAAAMSVHAERVVVFGPKGTAIDFGTCAPGDLLK